MVIPWNFQIISENDMCLLNLKLTETSHLELPHTENVSLRKRVS